MGSTSRSLLRKENAPENFGLLRRLALCLLERDTSPKGSIKGRRLRVSWDADYLLQVGTISTAADRSVYVPDSLPGKADSG